MLLTCWFACRRKMMYSGIALTRRMRDVSAARWRGTTAAGSNSATASAPSTRMGWRAERSSRKAAPKGLGHPSSILPCSGEGVLCSLGEMGTTLHRKLPAHRCFVQVTELTAMLERSTWLDYLTDKDTALAAGAKGGSIWEKTEPSPVLTTTKVALKWLHSCMKVWHSLKPFGPS